MVTGNTYYLDHDITINSWVTLTIEPWVVVKFDDWHKMTVYWTLSANWNSWATIVFTSKNDDFYWYTITWSTWSPLAWSWQYVYFREAWSSASVMDYVHVKYAGSNSTYWSISILNSNVNIINWLVSNSKYSSIIITSWSPTVSNNGIALWGNYDSIVIKWWSPTVQNNVVSWWNDWIYITWWTNMTVTGNSVSLKTWYGVLFWTAEPILVWNNNTINTNGQDDVYNIMSLAITSTAWTLKSDRTIFVVWPTTISSWKTLTIPSWLIIKFNLGQTVTSYWNIQASWTSWSNIIFTSKNDNSVWATIPWSTWTPSTWNWGYLYIRDAWSSASIFDYVQLRYGWSNQTYWSIRILNSNATITNSLIDYSRYNWIIISSWNPTVTDNTITNGWTYDAIKIALWSPTVQNNTIVWGGDWIYITWGTNMTVTDNNISWNSWYGVLYWTAEPILVWNNNTINTNGQDDVYNIMSLAITSTAWTLKSDRTIFVVWPTTISSWKTLTIPSWLIIKFNLGQTVTSYWNIQASWTSWSNIIFTSKNDNSVWATIPWSTWTPSTWNWGYLYIRDAWSSASIFDYVQLRYGWSNQTYWSIRILNSNATITNSLIYYSRYNWIVISSWNPIINSNIIINWTYSWIKYTAWTPVISYNLFYNNSIPADNYTLDWTNITWTDPQVNVWLDWVSQASATINMWDPAFWNHSVTWDRYDIWPFEFAWNFIKTYAATISWVDWRTLTYEWSLLSEPSIWNTVITSATWTITADWSIAVDLLISKIWAYQVQLEIKEWWTVIATWTNSFNISN